MNEFFVVLLAVVLIVAIFAGAIIFVEDVSANQCKALAENANISTLYMDYQCHVDVCGSWVRESNLAYHINAIKVCP